MRTLVGRLLRLIIAPMVVLLVAATRPFIRLHVLELTSKALGHLIIHIDFYLRRKSVGRYGKKDVFVFFCGPPANRYLPQLLGRHVNLVTNHTANRLYALAAPAILRCGIYDGLIGRAGWCAYPEYSLGRHQVRLEPAEMRRGAEMLARHGIGDDDWFVTIHARDSGFHAAVQPGRDNTYHDYRDSDINAFRKVIDHILERGGHVIRMGVHVAVELKYQPPGVIDLTNDHDDFMDLYLIARCRFMLSGNSGTAYLPHLFDVPHGVHNMNPYGDFPLKRDVPYTPKLLRRKEGGQVLPFRELHEMGLISGDRLTRQRQGHYVTKTYEAFGLEWVENSEDELLGLCLDVLDQIEGREPPVGAREAQKLFSRTYLSEDPYIEYAGAMAPRFALKYAHLM
ncbi:MAG: TIGR04372 family glycosyltransferase [Magnetospirillum sp.]|nr:TIGR04372 family glycosyltransferase [Magnetospirillum sp.]